MMLNKKVVSFVLARYFFMISESMEEQRIDLIAQFEQERRHWEKEKLALEEKCNEAKKLNAKIIKSSQSKPEEVVLENDQLGLTMEAVSC